MNKEYLKLRRKFNLIKKEVNNLEKRKDKGVIQKRKEMEGLDKQVKDMLKQDTPKFKEELEQKYGNIKQN